MTDVMAALIGYLAAQTAITALVPSSRIFGGEIPKTQVAAMPQKAIVLRLAPGAPNGPGDRDMTDLSTTGIDVFAYGENFTEASKVRRAVYDAMKAVLRLKTSSTLLHYAHRRSGPMQMKDPDGDWPVVIEAWLVMASTVTAS